MPQIKFIKSPTGLFNLAYNVGEVGIFSPEKAQLLIESGVGELCEDTETATIKFEVETPEKTKRKK